MADAPPRPLIVRLRNWVGDVVLALPTLQRLHEAGHELQLLGKPWAADLLAGHGWATQSYPAQLRDRLSLLRSLRRAARAADAGFERRLNALCFPFSFSSALEMRLAGLQALGHRGEGRAWLLSRSVPRLAGSGRPHELEVYWALGSELLATVAAPPARIGLRSSPAHLAAARELMAAHRLQPGFVVACPFAGGTFEGQDKTWPGFAAFTRQAQEALRRPVVVVPGPGEEAEARAHFSHCTVLEGVRLGAYAALLRQAGLMISNDTGPGHLAAAVGAPLISVLGPTDPRQWRAWGPQVSLLQPVAGQSWPDAAAVLDLARQRLAPA